MMHLDSWHVPGPISGHLSQYHDPYILILVPIIFESGHCPIFIASGPDIGYDPKLGMTRYLVWPDIGNHKILGLPDIGICPISCLKYDTLYWKQNQDIRISFLISSCLISCLISCLGWSPAPRRADIWNLADLRHWRSDSYITISKVQPSMSKVGK